MRTEDTVSAHCEPGRKSVFRITLDKDMRFDGVLSRTWGTHRQVSANGEWLETGYELWLDQGCINIKSKVTGECAGFPVARVDKIEWDFFDVKKAKLGLVARQPVAANAAHRPRVLKETEE